MSDTARRSERCPVALGVVVYNPGATLVQRLEAAIEDGVSVFLFDNSPDSDTTRNFAASRRESCHYSTCGKNLGLGIGISSVCANAFYSGYRALVFFDQDTVFDTRTLRFVEHFYRQQSGLELQHSAVVFNAKEGSSDAFEASALHPVDVAISSGTLFYLSNLKRLNWHNDTYFVDGVDYEFCLASRRHGYRIAEYRKTPGFDHSSEQPDSILQLFGRAHPVRRYSVGRIFDTVQATSRLALTALFAGQLRFFALMVRSLAIYGAFQVVARFLKRKQTSHPVSR